MFTSKDTLRDLVETFFNTTTATSHSGLVDAFPSADAITVFDDSYRIDVELPGVKKDSVSINIDGLYLVVTAEKLSASSNGKTVSTTRRFGKVTKKYKLTDSVVESDISAKMEDGILYIFIPKSKEKKSTKININ